MNVLFVGAHHDDLELSIGGSVRRWVDAGHRVYSAILTDSTWTGPDGRRFRDPEQVEASCVRAAELLGYTPFSLSYSPALELTFSDAKVVDLLKLIGTHGIDTLVTITPADAHPDHRAAAEIALAASRKVPRVLLTRVSWNPWPGVFRPTYFVDVTAQFPAKQAALRCYEDEYGRTGALWEKFMRSTGELYGLEAGCELAEGFEIVRFLE